MTFKLHNYLLHFCSTTKGVRLNPPTWEEVLWKISKFLYMHHYSAVTLHAPQGRITGKESRCCYRENRLWPLRED